MPRISNFTRELVNSYLGKIENSGQAISYQNNIITNYEILRESRAWLAWKKRDEIEKRNFEEMCSSHFQMRNLTIFREIFLLFFSLKMILRDC